MKKLSTTITLLLVALLISCETTTDCCVPPPNEEQAALLGPWLLYERGYSPGGGYITEDIPPLPAQLVTFKVNYTLTSSYPTFAQYKFYDVFVDPMDSERQVLALYEESPGTDPLLEDANAQYTIEYTGTNLKLYQRWCIEGCHLAFKRPE